jgi:hypothetical protein
MQIDNHGSIVYSSIDKRQIIIEEPSLLVRHSMLFSLDISMTLEKLDTVISN